MTIRKMIERLEELAQQYGDDMRVCVFDNYTANEGCDFEEEDLYTDAYAKYNIGMKVILIC